MSGIYSFTDRRIPNALSQGFVSAMQAGWFPALAAFVGCTIIIARDFYELPYLSATRAIDPQCRKSARGRARDLGLSDLIQAPRLSGQLITWIASGHWPGGHSPRWIIGGSGQGHSRNPGQKRLPCRDGVVAHFVGHPLIDAGNCDLSVAPPYLCDKRRLKRLLRAAVVIDHHQVRHIRPGEHLLDPKGVDILRGCHSTRGRPDGAAGRDRPSAVS